MSPPCDKVPFSAQAGTAILPCDRPGALPARAEVDVPLGNPAASASFGEPSLEQMT